jgi:hypothetical protein
VIQKYLSSPLLINNLKFDIRLYVVVTGIDPLRIYLYNDGLVRFATAEYQLEDKGMKFSHLTNYSVNKKNENFVQNKNSSEQDIGSKWSLSALQAHLRNLGINVEVLWGRIYDLVIKSFLCVESHVYNAHKRTGKSMNTSYQLFGYDIMLDNQLNPWILEVNLSPSLATDSPIDRDIKSNLVTDIFNLVGVRKTVPKTAGRRQTTRNLKVTSPGRHSFYRMNETGQSPKPRFLQSVYPSA